LNLVQSVKFYILSRSIRLWYGSEENIVAIAT